MTAVWRRAVAAVLVGATLALAACGGPAAAKAPAAVYRLKVEIVDTSNPIFCLYESCAPDALASGGVPLTVTNQSGAVVGADPSFAASFTFIDSSDDDVYSTTLAVPREQFYVVKFGEGVGTFTEPFSSLVAHHWLLSLTYSDSG